MRSRSSFLVALVLVLATFAQNGHAASPPSASNSLGIDSAFLARAQASTEPLRLLVRLAVPFTAEGRRSLRSAQDQRTDISKRQDRVLALLASRQVDAFRRFRHVPFLAIEVEPAALADLLSSPDVASVQEDLPSSPTLTQSIPLIGADVAWGLGYAGQGQTIVILDSGVDSSHAFLQGKVVAQACFSGAFSPSSSLCPNGLRTDLGSNAGEDCPASLPSCDHGTHVAGIAAGRGTSFSGVARDAGLISIQVFSRFDTDVYCGAGQSPCILSWTSDQIAALDYIYSTLRNSYTIAAVNLSLGGGSSTTACDGDSRKPAIDNLRSVGVATVIAAGNGGSRTALSFPACISSAISVSSTTDNDGVSAFSNVASFLSFFAPGDSILSSIPGGGFQTWAGTSMAAPHVAGAWAILRSKSPLASVNEIYSALEGSGPSILDGRSGGTISRPRIQVDAALQILALPATPTATTTFTATATSTPSATSTATATPSPTATSTPTPLSTSTGTPTPTASTAPTESPTATPVPGSVLGDLDLDGVVNVLDVQLCVNVFLGTETRSGIVARSDMNTDGQTNVLDVQLLANIFLGV